MKYAVVALCHSNNLHISTYMIYNLNLILIFSFPKKCIPASIFLVSGGSVEYAVRFIGLYYMIPSIRGEIIAFTCLVLIVSDSYVV